MKQSEIIHNIQQRLGIAALNELQTAAMACRSRAMVILAPTGSGKTVAFAIPLLNSLGEPGGGIRGLVIAPTRELVLQVAEVLRKAGYGYRTAALYGGHSFEEESRTLSVTPDIVVATPGRLLDHIQRGTADVSAVKALVIDEYDKALELGFLGQMSKIGRRLGRLRLTVVTSATALADLPGFIDLSGAETIDFRSNTALNTGRLQTVRIEAPARDKLDTLVDLLHTMPDGAGTLIFVNHRDSAERVYERLRREGAPVGLYHGGLQQQEREMALALFANGSTPVLVTTDLASRGLDIDGVEAVVHYHMPPSAESWTHRNGRTARMGADGNVYVITSEADNIPDYVVWQREYVPKPKDSHRFSCRWRSLYFAAGKKDKISRGDIAGFLMCQGGIDKEQLGRITLGEHYALAAVDATVAGKVLSKVAPLKIKNKKVKITLV
ncbi:MAG: DEAD/DEAH box helicase [Muribaculaceae bacterium]|nr:DEAD/DEAH box helicase [Muribaculaceae bacterium]